MTVSERIIKSLFVCLFVVVCLVVGIKRGNCLKCGF